MDSKKQTNKIETPAGSRIGRIAKDFFLGCIALIPLAVFVFIFYYLILLFEALGAMIFGLTKSVKTTVAVTVFIVFLLIYTGRKLRRKEKWIFNIVDQVISKIPVVGGWYSTFQEMVQTFTAGGGERGYLGTAKVPCGDGYIIGFVTKRETAEDGSPRVTIFVPTSPNPTTGLVFFFPEEKVEYLDLTPEKAFTKIISLGMKS
ncbi:MAG: DUF502 domain-containing protein [Synergistaceae bacterium]|jgi:uncharacterized membrane protein|nr:DUF502 domain-containing protein [Synergistaceae bacterium]MDY0284130.1 DUF502 domain-containing protein [Synergistaceae bacterium]